MPQSKIQDYNTYKQLYTNNLKAQKEKRGLLIQTEISYNYVPHNTKYYIYVGFHIIS